MAEVRRRSVGGNWTWFEDYIFASANWTAFCPADRTVQVGMGVSFLGTPRGEKIRFSGRREFTTIGLGAIHFRIADGRGPCEVVLHSGKAKGIDLPTITFQSAGSEALGGAEASGSAAASKFAFDDPERAEAAERINKLFRRLIPAGAQDASAVAQELSKLEERSGSLEQQFHDLRDERYALRRQFTARAEDLGADCDANRCRSEKKNEPITAGETDLFVHDDQDRGSVTVFCHAGEIEVVISTAVWGSFNEYDRKRLGAGQTWKRDIGSQSSWYDQTNRVEVIGKADATYNLDFTSWDD